MFRHPRSSTPLWTTLLLCLAVAAACSSAPETTEDEPTLALAAAEDLLQSPDVLVAAKLQIDALDDLAPLVDAAPITTPGVDMNAIERFSSDPVAYFSDLMNIDGQLPALHRDQPTYAMLTSAGHATFIDALRYGLPTFEGEWPTHLNLRVLLPTDDPDALSTELDPYLEALPDLSEVGAVQAFEGPSFVRLEVALDLQAPYANDVDADAWLAGLRLDHIQPPATADFRPTEAYLHFAEGDTTMGLWSRASDISALGALELWHDFSTSYQRVATEGQPRYFLHGLARMAASGAVNDPVAAEFEDLAITAQRDQEAMIVDFAGTRTAHGSRLQDARGAAPSLPEVLLDDVFLELRIASHHQALDELLVAPLWTALDGDPDAFGQDLMATSGSVLPFMEDDAFLPVIAAFLQYPQAFLAYGSAEFEGLFPIPDALGVQGFTQGPEAFMPLGLVASAGFDDMPQTRASIEQLLSMAEANFPGTFDAELLSKSGDRLELRFAFGTTIADAFTDGLDSPAIDDQHLSLDITALSDVDGVVPDEAEDVDLLDHLHLRSRADQRFSTLRWTLGSAEARPAAELQGDAIDPIDPQSRCATEIPLIAIEHLSNLQARPRDHIEQWAQSLEDIAPDCFDPTHPQIHDLEARIDRAFEIVDQIQ